MTLAAPPLAGAREAQRRAADPSMSAWVSANAGSGKTRVLIERVARLLLFGVRPERILCLTYTTAAASEMKRRLGERLGAWALMDDAPLRLELAELVAEADPAPGAPALDAARRLFAQALETPGGLRIQTIHAFCDAALRRFPLEAGVAPDFAVLDDAARGEVVAAACERLAAAGDGAFDAMAALVGEETLDAIHADVLQRRALFADPPDLPRLAAAFGVDPAALDAPPYDGFWDGVDRAALMRAAQALAVGKTSDAKCGEALAAALSLNEPRAAAEGLRPALLTTTGEPRKLDRLPTKDVDAASPWIRPLLAATQARLVAFADRAAAAAATRRAEALNRYAAAFLAAYEDEKRRRGALDFDDLIARAGRLLTAGGMARWAQYKLDGGVEHLLVDEAQDTSPGQWAVVRALAGEMLSEPGRDGRPRTLFVVGDVKQSIYSFQGAEPALFGATREQLRDSERAAGRLLDAPELLTSFRSSDAILRAVDRTFADAHDGLDGPPQHFPSDVKAGRADLWPLLPKEEEGEEPAWDAPLDHVPPTNPRVRLARALAAEIARWTREERLPGADRRVRAGDVLVLVRRRDALARELVRALQREGVAVAGADRVEVGRDLAVRDLLALARFALTPEDDLSLAALLRSPLCGLSLEAVEALALGREGRLWDALRAAPEHAGVAVALQAARDEADFLRPYEFFERALTDRGGRRALVARLGREAEDPLDELLARALAYEAVEAPTLEGFLAWMAASRIEIKRELDGGAGAVRVMTVHGAKGLEAPVVVLPDCGPQRAGGRPKPILPAADARGRFAVWRLSKADAPQAMAAMKEAADAEARREDRRLLYVAMTRAERWLVVCGAGQPAAEADDEQEDARPSKETWHGLVAAGLAALGPAPLAPPAGLAGEALRYELDGPVRAADPAPVGTAVAARPDWLDRRPPAPPAAPARLGASALGGEAAGGGAGVGAEAARRRGVAVHALLERLPDAPLAARPALAARLLDALAPTADAAARAAMLAEAEAAMALPEAADVFHPDALAEAAISVSLGPLRATGRIDRLRVTADRVLAVDFKTDAAPPPPGAAPEPYLRQMAAYRAALAALHPGRTVAVALLWTGVPRLDPLGPAALDAALARALAEA